MTAETLFNPSEKDIAAILDEYAGADRVLVKKVHQDDLVVLYFKHLSELEENE